jgi:hypothetical protein
LRKRKKNLHDSQKGVKKGAPFPRFSSTKQKREHHGKKIGTILISAA